MSFKRTSLKARQRKKHLKKAGKYTALFGKKGILLTLGLLIAIPGAIFGFTRNRKHRRMGKIVRTSFGVAFVIVAFSIALVHSGVGKKVGTELVFSLGAELPKDEHGFTNILMLGVGGGEAHAAKGHKLTDSMMIASIDATGRSVVLLSIPRDFYVETEYTRGRVNSVLRDESPIFLRELRNQPEHAEALSGLSGQERVEYIWRLEAQADRKAEINLKKALEKVFELDIHRIARIDFRGFEKAVDAIGGIDVVVDTTIDDQTYPDFEWGYDPFHLDAGLQHLDGATALKYARSRHNTSDFDRAARQQKVISAIREKLVSLEVLTSPSKLRELFAVFQENFISDLSWEEIISLAEVGSKMPRDNIISYVLNNNPATTGGFLVTPDRDLYGGAFVLVPFLNLTSDKYAQIRAFVAMIFEHRALTGTDPLSINIYNATKISGLAGSLQTALERYGWKVGEIDNTEETEATTRVRFTDTPRNRAAIDLLQRFMKLELEPHPKTASMPAQNMDESLSQTPEAEEIFEIIIGTDYEQPYRSPDFLPSLIPPPDER